VLVAHQHLNVSVCFCVSVVVTISVHWLVPYQWRCILFIASSPWIAGVLCCTCVDPPTH